MAQSSILKCTVPYLIRSLWSIEQSWSIMKVAKDLKRLSLSLAPYSGSIWTGEESQLEPMHNYPYLES